MKTFLDELLEEAEAKEESMLLSHVDLCLAEVGDLQSQIEKNFATAEDEVKIIKNWSLSKNSKLQDRISWIEAKLEVFMSEQPEDVKSVELANGSLHIRKQPKKVEIIDLELFMKNKKLYQLATIQQETIKPNLNMIKKFLTMNDYRDIPEGVKVTEQQEKFSIKIKQHGGSDEREQTKAGTRVESANTLTASL